MHCPICNCEAKPGGLIVDGVTPVWVPMAEFHRRGLRRLIYKSCRTIGKTNYLLSQTRIEDAFYCSRCNKIIGIFDVTNAINPPPEESHEQPRT